jgi:toxin ParE1/3/4
LTAAIGELASSPMIASVCHHIRPGYRRHNVERHMIYFRVALYVLPSFASCMAAWLHGCMDASRHL